MPHEDPPSVATGSAASTAGTYLLEWNPELWPWQKVQAEMHAAHKSGSEAIRWDVGGNRDPQLSDRVFLMRVRSQQGIVGAGRISKAPADALHWHPERAAKGQKYTFVEVIFQQLFEAPLITLAELRLSPFAGHNWVPRRSGRPIPEPFATALANRWAEVAVLPDDSGLVQDLDEIDKQENVDTTTKKALIDARKGQGKFRAAVLQAWDGSCSVTGSTIRAAIRASHIKPWRESSNAERLDPDNGLPLIANLDALFDAGFISFDSAGHLIVSSKVNTKERDIFGIGEKSLRKQPNAKMTEYLAHHRAKHGFNP
jgi:hypothetical protein